MVCGCILIGNVVANVFFGKQLRLYKDVFYPSWLLYMAVEEFTNHWGQTEVGRAIIYAFASIYYCLLHHFTMFMLYRTVTELCTQQCNPLSLHFQHRIWTLEMMVLVNLKIMQYIILSLWGMEYAFHRQFYAEKKLIRWLTISVVLNITKGDETQTLIRVFGLIYIMLLTIALVHKADWKRASALSQANPACSFWLKRTYRYRSMRQQWHDIELVGVGQELTLEYDHIKYTANPLRFPHLLSSLKPSGGLHAAVHPMLRPPFIYSVIWTAHQKASCLEYQNIPLGSAFHVFSRVQNITCLAFLEPSTVY